MEFTDKELELLINILFDAVVNPDYSKSKSDQISELRNRFKNVRDYGHDVYPVDPMGEFMGKNT